MIAMRAKDLLRTLAALLTRREPRAVPVPVPQANERKNNRPPSRVEMVHER